MYLQRENNKKHAKLIFSHGFKNLDSASGLPNWLYERLKRNIYTKNK